MLRLLDIQLRNIRLRTRMPFRYGIAELRELPHLFLVLDAEVDGRRSKGIASDHLPPRWFTKIPSQSPEEEIDAMLAVVRHAVSQAADSTADSPFNWWRDAYPIQMEWARSNDIPPLLAHFGLTLVERAVISAFCHAKHAPFHRLLLQGELGFDPAKVYPELEGFDWRNSFPPSPRKSILVRHTVGLGDPILEADVPTAERLSDGLPQSLEASIRAYGLRHFKIKLCGEFDTDRKRLAAIMRCIEANAVNAFAYSLDGNESYPHFDDFREQWLALSKLPELQRHRDKLLFVEQPVYRDHALAEDNAATLTKLADTPIIIDESDAEIESLPQALNLGYCGTSHKNCKGVFKGLAAKCLLASRQTTRSEAVPKLIHSGEDLSNVGPVALLQDLTVMASLDIPSVERNGHHYFAGLSAFSDELCSEVLDTLPDLFRTDAINKACLAIQGGSVSLSKLLDSPFAPRFVRALDHTIPLPVEWEQCLS